MDLRKVTVFPLIDQCVHKWQFFILIYINLTDILTDIKGLKASEIFQSIIKKKHQKSLKMFKNLLIACMVAISTQASQLEAGSTATINVKSENWWEVDCAKTYACECI